MRSGGIKYNYICATVTNNEHRNVVLGVVKSDLHQGLFITTPLLCRREEREREPA